MPVRKLDEFAETIKMKLLQELLVSQQSEQLLRVAVEATGDGDCLAGQPVE